jgi:DNA-binding response OmpR family regulator
LIVGEIALDTRTHNVLVRGKPVQFTSTEYRLLEELMRHAGSVMPHNLLIERVWGPEYAGEDHYLKVFIRRLRQKLGDDARNPRYIQNEWGIGYRFIAA